MNAIRTLRKELGLTQAQLARLAGIGQSSISERETGHNPTSREAILALLYLKTLSRAELDALLADPSKLED